MILELHGVFEEYKSEGRKIMIANPNNIQIESPDKVDKFIEAQEKLRGDMTRTHVQNIEEENTTVK